MAAASSTAARFAPSIPSPLEPRKRTASALAGPELAERHVLVDANVCRKPEDPFGDDVAQHFLAAAGNAQARGIEQRLLKPGLHRRELGLHYSARHAPDIAAVRGDVPELAGAHQPRDRGFA